MEDVLVGGSGREDMYTSDDESLRSTRVTDYTEATRHTHDSRLDEEEKKMNDSASISVSSGTACVATATVLSDSGTHHLFAWFCIIAEPFPYRALAATTSKAVAILKESRTDTRRL